MENSDKRKILIFSTAYHPFVGGAEVAIKEITDRIGNNFDFDLITARLRKDLPKVEKVGNITVYRIGNGNKTLDKLLLPFLGAIKAWKLNNINNYYCIWAMMVTFGSGAGYIFNIFRFFSGKKTVPIILTLQEGDSESHLKYKWGGLIALSWKIALRQTTVLTGISNFLLDRAKKNGWKKDGVLVPNGVDLKIFSKEVSENEKKDIEMSLQKTVGDVFLVTTGRLTSKNATDDIISALTYLNKNFHLIVIGKGDDGPKLQKLANDLGVASRVKFLGFLPYDQIPKYFSVCDIFIRPSRSEGFGNSFIEAMASKLPVIATPVGGIPDFIDDNETGIFCAPNNPQSIAKAVDLISEDSSLKQKIINNAYNMVTERYSWDTISHKMKAVFDKVS
ncbi:MAG: Glycosyltransferase [Parcubacteria bacterium C7867-006]|nr:MAG: Glycosyltransferase [Parcubacteria bacterium C7867-006]